MVSKFGQFLTVVFLILAITYFIVLYIDAYYSEEEQDLIITKKYWNSLGYYANKEKKAQYDQIDAADDNLKFIPNYEIKINSEDLEYLKKFEKELDVPLFGNLE